MNGVRRSFLISVADKYSKQLIALFSTVILARILTPEDVGTFSIALGITTVSAMLRDFGVSAYLIQERELTEPRLQSALGMVCVTAAVMGIGLVLLAAPLSDFYHKPDMRYAIYVLSLIFFFVPFNAIVMTLLRREMNFGAIYRMSFTGALAGASVSVSTALLGAGFMCMAYGSVANSIATFTMAYRQRPRQYRMRPRFIEWRRVVSYGALASLTNIIVEMGRRTPDLVIGRILGLAAVGLFSRANGLVTLMTESLVTPVMAVAISVFSIKNRQSGEVKQLYLEALSLLTSVSWPAFIFVAAMSFPVIRILSGSQWDAAVPLAHFTCVGGAFSALLGLQYAVFQAVGAVRFNLVATFVTTILRVLVIFWASYYGLLASVIALALSSFVSFGIIEHYVNRVLKATFRDTFGAIWRSMVIAAMTGVVPIAVASWGGTDPRTIWVQIAVSAVGGGLSWLAAVHLTNHSVKKEINLVFSKVTARTGMLGIGRSS
jgi:O-antigen/teichoic acid export membrane protein